MNPMLLERYSSNIILREIGGIGQKRLSQSNILIIGAGGLGTPSLQYLTASGVGTIGVVDFDTVSLSNLQRQVIFGVEDIGKFKVESAKSKLKELNPNTQVVAYPFKLSDDNVEETFSNYDLILDGTDNYSTRYLVNRCCFKLKKPLIFGAISQWDGQISMYDPCKPSACYECSNKGVLGPLVGIVGSLMAAEAIKFITHAGSPLTNEIIVFDALNGLMRRYKTCSRPKCKVCGSA